MGDSTTSSLKRKKNGDDTLLDMYKEKRRVSDGVIFLYVLGDA